MKVLVTAATGTVGTAVCRALAHHGASVHAMSRNPDDARDMEADHVHLVQGDLKDRSSVEAALEGMDQMFLLVPPSPHTDTLKAPAIAATQASGVGGVVSLSAMGADPDASLALPRSHGRADAALAESGVDHTILRPHWFMENLYASANDVMMLGTLFQPLGDGRIGMITVEDVAEVAARCLMAEDHTGEAHDLTGPRSLSMHQVVQTMTEVLGAEIRYEAQSPPQAKDQYMQWGLPEELADAFVELFTAFANGAGDMTTSTLEAILGRPPRAFEVWLREHKTMFEPPAEPTQTS